MKDHRASNAKISLSDTLMSGFAMFCLKDPSLLAFGERRQEYPDNLNTVFRIKRIPCDSQMRTTLDPVSVSELRRPFKSVFAQLQRGKVLEKMTWLDGHYLLALDGTGIYTSEKMGSDYCLRKRKRNGKVEYYQQMLAGAFVHPERSEVIPTCPEMIIKQDGCTKNDCERNAAKRYLVKQLCCPLFQAAHAKCRSRGSLWEKIRIVFKIYLAKSMEEILHCIASGIPKQKMEIQWE